MEKESSRKDDLDSTERLRRISKRFSVFFLDFLGFLKDLLSISHDTDYEKTHEGVVRDIPFRGHTVYILICSIFIASIGLNVNSPAVIIGAMLIAPLMGPIIGTGFALGTNDAPLLIKALKNFAVMTIVSLITSTFYFLITPLVEYQPELLARTKPTTLDIFVAIFGGIAGIVAGSRKEKSNVIPGVAIATALMPPLCTSGFGLATGNWAFFFGAFYLFMINSVFICVSTVIGVRYLRFPLKEFVDKARERKVRVYMITFTTVLFLPSLYIFWGVLRESYFKSQADLFIAREIKMSGAKVINSKLIWHDEKPVIEVFMLGDDVPADTIALWQSKLSDYKLNEATLEIYKGGGSTVASVEALSGRLKQDIVEDLFMRNQDLLNEKQRKIEMLEDKLDRLSLNYINLSQLSRELKIQFPTLEKVSYAYSLESEGTGRVDTIPTFMLKWKPGYYADDVYQKEQLIKELMLVRLNLDTLRILRY